MVTILNGDKKGRVLRGKEENGTRNLEAQFAYAANLRNVRSFAPFGNLLCHSPNRGLSTDGHHEGRPRHMIVRILEEKKYIVNKPEKRKRNCAVFIEEIFRITTP